jgi:serine/threonine protein kinase
MLAQKNDKRNILLLKKLIPTGQNTNDEIDLLKNLHHPNIVEYIESSQDHNEICIIIEYVNGSHLRNFSPMTNLNLEKHLFARLYTNSF